MQINIPALVAQLTLEEKAGLCSGADSWHTKAVARLAIPDIMVSDGPHGLRKQAPASADPDDSIQAVCFPAACATAASFDTTLCHREGELLGDECRAEGVSVLLGPAVNLKRSPLCGRNFEYYSEDPFLAGSLAAAFISGVQSRGVGTSIKHFAANNQEYRRMTVMSEMAPRTLRELYLPAFERAVKEAQPMTVMCSYNGVNGTLASENKTLLTDILRGEWGFDGVVMSDWGAVNDRVKALQAGLELEMPSSQGVNDQKIIEAVRAGTLSEAVLDQAVTRLLNLIYRCHDAAQQPETPVFDRPTHHQAATEMETECAVLLKNKGVLPLKAGQKVVYIGGFAETPRYQGGGSSHIRASRVVSALDAAEEKGRMVQFVRGYPANRDEREEAEFMRAVDAAERAEVAVIFAGLPDSFECEGYDRKHMRLPECQNNLIARVAAVQPNTVVVLHTGSPVECPWAEDVAGVLCLYLGGEGVGAAADALLYGDANPCGRLPESWPLRLEDSPSYLNFPGDGKHARYAEGVYVGYRWYDARQMCVRWPFGHGLSYTGFVYHAPRISAPVLADGQTVTVSLEVKNTGALPGKEVVQLYVADATGTPGRPPKELKGFAKLALNPGEEKTVSFTLSPRDFSYYDEALGDWYATPGRYKILLGHSSRNLPAALEVTVQTARRLPMQVGANTVMGDLLRDDRTAALAREIAQTYFAGKERRSDAAQEAITPEMNLQMLENAPLRRLRGLQGTDEAGLQAVIAKLQAAVDAAN
ncbi:MAG: glycoside hydrolase family 3 C-terminal domain-containing protein [Gemmiger sp.]|nr:glycoside hydrolase family 3 C-terminal domain-containing protein [Gemmiger sp.]